MNDGRRARLIRWVRMAPIMWLTVIPSSGARSECSWTSFEKQVGQARIIFAGTVRSTSLTRAMGMEATRFRFEQVQYAKGSGPSDSVILVELGGPGLWVEGGISFRLGTRYIVLATQGSDPGTFSALGCGTGHPFEITPDAGGTLPVVHSFGGYPLVAFDDRHAVALRTKRWDPEREPHYTGIPWVPAPPPRRDLAEVLADLDSTGEFEGQPRYWVSPRPRSTKDGIRWAWLYPHQDPGNRVSEQEMLRVLAGIAASGAYLRKSDNAGDEIADFPAS